MRVSGSAAARMAKMMFDMAYKGLDITERGVKRYIVLNNHYNIPDEDCSHITLSPTKADGLIKEFNYLGVPYFVEHSTLNGQQTRTITFPKEFGRYKDGNSLSGMVTRYVRGAEQRPLVPAYEFMVEGSEYVKFSGISAEEIELIKRHLRSQGKVGYVKSNDGTYSLYALDSQAELLQDAVARANYYKENHPEALQALMRELTNTREIEARIFNRSIEGNFRIYSQEGSVDQYLQFDSKNHILERVEVIEGEPVVTERANSRNVDYELSVHLMVSHMPKPVIIEPKDEPHKDAIIKKEYDTDIDRDFATAMIEAEIISRIKERIELSRTQNGTSYDDPEELSALISDTALEYAHTYVPGLATSHKKEEEELQKEIEAAYPTIIESIRRMERKIQEQQVAERVQPTLDQMIDEYEIQIENEQNMQQEISMDMYGPEQEPNFDELSL